MYKKIVYKTDNDNIHQIQCTIVSLGGGPRLRVPVLGGLGTYGCIAISGAILSPSAFGEG